MTGQEEQQSTMATDWYEAIDANTEAIAELDQKLEATSKKLDEMAKADSQHFKELMTAIHAIRDGIPTFDVPESSSSNLHTTMHQEVTDNSRRDEIPFQGVILEHEHSRGGENEHEGRQFEQDQHMRFQEPTYKLHIQE